MRKCVGQRERGVVGECLRQLLKSILCDRARPYIIIDEV